MSKSTKIKIVLCLDLERKWEFIVNDPKGHFQSDEDILKLNSDDSGKLYQFSKSS